MTSTPVKRHRVFLALAIGLMAISSAAVLIKACDAPSLAIAFYRLLLGALFYIVLQLRRGKSWGPVRQHFVWIFVSGLALALHFATWITSLNYTSVASSVVLVCTSPLWVSIGAALFLKEKTSALMGAGLVITIAGSWIISQADFSVAPEQLIGNALALLGALFAAVYLLIGRKLRPYLDTIPYVTLVYTVAAVFTGLFVLIYRTPLLHFDIQTYALLLALALLPQVIGHTSFNWSLKYFSATAVSVVILAEPVGASFLAWLFLRETIAPVQLIGMIVILVGVSVALYVEYRQTKKRQSG